MPDPEEQYYIGWCTIAHKDADAIEYKIKAKEKA
jgi:hypothetical protein